MYQALYRKYRPKNFQEVVSQQPIIKTLENAIKSNHINHAYLFSGPRGTGKTTVAKIFARAVNCLNSQNAIICENCKNCLYSKEKECMDIIEIDAASNNGVDEIRELRSKVSILPTELKYKVYIIDEVHMLSIGAFNALLKTLEEPPKHVIFILATTDPQKIPSTILSRCQSYAFKKITPTEIKEQLMNIAEKENIEIDEEVLKAISYASDGGLRDAIGLLDKVSSYQKERITLDDYLSINGELNSEKLEQLKESIFTHNAKKMLEFLDEAYQSGKDLIRVLKQLMLHIKNILVNYYLTDSALLYDEQEMLDFINLLNEKMNELKKADDVKMYIEIMLLHFIKHHENKKIISREIISSSKVENNDLILPKEKTDQIKTSEYDNKLKEKIENYEIFKNLMVIRSQNSMIEAEKKELEIDLKKWEKLNDFTFDSSKGYLACELLDGKPRASSGNTLIISYEYEGLIEKMSFHFEKLVEFYQEVMNSEKNIAIITDSKWNELKTEYVRLMKDGKKFDYQKEPLWPTIKNKAEESLISSKKKDTIEEAVELFGDLVEIE